MKATLLKVARNVLPLKARRQLAECACWPPVGMIRFGNLRRLSPISRHWGADRGLPIDRYYIEKFLLDHADDIRGHGLEVKEDLYSTRFGGGRISKIDILHPDDGNPNATIVADLTNADHLASNMFDFIVLTQTLQLIYDVRTAVAMISRILKPGGVLLATVSGISKISRQDMDRWGHNWGFTTQSTGLLFHEFFPADNIKILAYGNVLTAISFLCGLASRELSPQELDYQDPDFQVLIAIRAVKPAYAE